MPDLVGGSSSTGQLITEQKTPIQCCSASVLVGLSKETELKNSEDKRVFSGTPTEMGRSLYSLQFFIAAVLPGCVYRLYILTLNQWRLVLKIFGGGAQTN